MRAWIRIVYSVMQRMVAPPFCAYCKQFLDVDCVLCDTCAALIMPVVSHAIEITKTKQFRVLAVGRYEDPLRALILSKRSSNRITSIQLGQLMWRMIMLSHTPFDCIVPIPLHWTRYAWRGYNQAEEIGRAIARESGKPMYTFLRRIKRTPYLTYFAADARAAALERVFALHGPHEFFQGKHLLLVDDVMTTGATLKAAARELWSAKPASITAVVVARVVR